MSASDVHPIVHICLLEETVRDVQCVATAQLQHESSDIIYVSITMLANHALLPRKGVAASTFVWERP